jgi:hypothetical protein
MPIGIRNCHQIRNRPGFELALGGARGRGIACSHVTLAPPQHLFFGMFYGLVKTGLQQAHGWKYSEVFADAD